MTNQRNQYDIIVAGSGASGLATAITAAHLGLSVLVIEKSEKFGGTTARSGGWLWIPNNRFAKEQGFEDSIEKARTYIQAESGNFFEGDKVDAFLTHAPDMLDFFHNNTAAKFSLGGFINDYHVEKPGGMAGGRSVGPDPVSRAVLGDQADKIAEPLPELTFLGMMIGSNRELRHFFEASRSVKSFGYVAALLARYGYERLRHGKVMRLTNGTALATRLAKSAFDRGVEIRTETALKNIETKDGKVVGVRVATPAGDQILHASKGVVLATGGFPFDKEMRKKLYPHAPNGENHYSPAYPTNTGDAMGATRKLNASIVLDYPHAAAWVPVSLVPRKDGTFGNFPHFVDRAKPGVIAVLKTGRRFVNEAESYHDYGAALIEAHSGTGPAESWLIVDHATIRYYGLGHVKPYPVPLWGALKSGYLIRGGTIQELAKNAGIDTEGLEKTVSDFNQHAHDTGDDPEFGRGSTSYNRYLGDPDHQPNPCVKPIETGPFYAIRVVVGDLGSFAGHQTDAQWRVLNDQGDVIEGLYAVGNDAASLFGGEYPGGGITLGPGMTAGYIAAHHLAGRPLSTHK